MQLSNHQPKLIYNIVQNLLLDQEQAKKDVDILVQEDFVKILLVLTYLYPIVVVT